MFYRCIHSRVYKMVLPGWVVDFDVWSKNEFLFQNVVVIVA